MEVGQLILIKNIDKIGGKKQEITKIVRPAVVRETFGENKVNVRLVSTIYSNKLFKVKNLEEAKEAIAENLKNKLPHESQYIILTPEKDGVLNYSYVYGNMFTNIIKLTSTNHIVLKDSKTKKPIIINVDIKIEIEEKEIEALLKNIIKEYIIEFKENI